MTTVIVEFAGQRDQISTDKVLSSKQELCDLIRHHFNTTDDLTIAYFDEELAEYFVLHDNDPFPEFRRTPMFMADTKELWEWDTHGAKWTFFHDDDQPAADSVAGLVIKMGTDIVEEAAYQKFETVCRYLDIKQPFTKVVAVSNKAQLERFTIFRASLVDRPRLLRREGETIQDTDRRAEHMCRLLSKNCPWNTKNSKLPPVIPMIHGTCYGNSQGVAEYGFHNLFHREENGLLGTGVYFSSSMSCAERHAGTNEPFYVISMVIPGNVLPLPKDRDPEDYRGRPLRTGFDSHHAMEGNNLRPGENELVISSRWQCLPLFVCVK